MNPIFLISHLHRSYILSDRMPRRINPFLFFSILCPMYLCQTHNRQQTNKHTKNTSQNERGKQSDAHTLRKATSKARGTVSVVLFCAPRGIVGIVGSLENCRFDNPPGKVTRDGLEEKAWRKGRKERTCFFRRPSSSRWGDQTTPDENSDSGEATRRGRGKGWREGNKRELDIYTPVERTKQRAHLWHSFSDPRRDKRNDEVRAKVQGKSRGIDRGDAWCRVEQS